MFDLKSPCNNCPFTKGKGSLFRLKSGRIAEIVEAPAFQCHKTLNKRPQQCAGLMGVLLNEGRHNEIMQAAVRLGFADLGAINRNACYDSIKQALEAHNGNEPE